MAAHNQIMNTKVLRTVVFSLLALSMAVGCTTSARGAENVPVVGRHGNYRNFTRLVPLRIEAQLGRGDDLV